MCVDFPAMIQVQPMGAPPPYQPMYQAPPPMIPNTIMVAGAPTVTYHQAQPVVTNVVVAEPRPTGFVVRPAAILSTSPIAMQCPHCKKDIITTTNFVIGTMTYVSAGIMCLLGLVCRNSHSLR